MNSFHPDLLDESADEIGSTRYNCNILLIQLYYKNYKCKKYDFIKHNNIFVIIELSPIFEKALFKFLPGVVVKKDLEYSWWFKLL